MVLTITVMCIAFAVLMIIAYMVFNDYQVQQEIDKKLLISKQKEIINETDDILLNVTQVPYSSQLVIILQTRILSALKQILTATPNAIQIKQRIEGITEQIKNSQATPPTEPSFTPPKDTAMALKMLKVLRRLRKIIRIEFNRGRMSQIDLVREDKRLEIMIFKIQFSNLLRNIDECELTKQFGTMQQLIASGLNSLHKLNIQDAWLESVQEHLTTKLDELNREISAKHLQEAQQERAKEEDDIDMLFQPKKKW